MPEVACVGIAVLDRLYRVAEFAAAPGKYRASSRRVVGGGVAANAAVTVSRLGGDARFLGVIGDDDAGREIVEGLSREQVDLSQVQVIEGRQSPESIVQIDESGERLIINHASPDLFERALPPPPAALAGADVVLADMRWRAGAVAALEWASRHDRPGVVDCDHDPGDSPGILEAASHVIFAARTLRQWTKTDDLSSALRVAHGRLGSWVAVTDGDRGSLWLDGARVTHLSAHTVDAVDTLGAGDVFHGAFALALAEGNTAAMAMGWASAAAAVKCTRFGGRDGIPTRDDVESFLEEQ